MASAMMLNTRDYHFQFADDDHSLRSLFRVRQFSNVELFAVTAGGEEGEEEEGTESEKMLEEMVGIQQEICSDLGLHYR